jgi:hypothetical protein
MKRPDDAITRPDTPIASSRSQHEAQTQQLEEIHTPYSLSSSNNRNEDGSGEFNLLSESNHTHFLLDSFYSSNLHQIIENRVGRSEGRNNDAAYSVWVDSPGQEQSEFSIYQFYHDLVRFLLQLI